MAETMRGNDRLWHLSGTNNVQPTSEPGAFPLVEYVRADLRASALNEAREALEEAEDAIVSLAELCGRNGDATYLRQLEKVRATLSKIGG